MAADWIKMRDDLDEDAAVLSIASTLSMDVDWVIGKLWRLWKWAGKNTRTGLMPLATPKMVDERVAREGFAQAMMNACWLEYEENAGLRFPKWSIHNSKSSKQRALSARRMANKRAKVLRTQRNMSVTREEESRGEKSKDTTAIAVVSPLAWSRNGFANADLHIPRWRTAYPDVDIRGELARMHEWLLAKPSRQRKKNWQQFATNWLNRSQADAGAGSEPRVRRTAAEAEALLESAWRADA